MRSLPRPRQASLTTLVLIAVTLAGCLGGQDPADDGDQVGTEASEGRVLQVDITAMPCPDGYDNGQDDDVCLAYNGQIPGPTWVFEQGEPVQIQLQNRVAESLEGMDVEGDLAKRLGEARYSMHRHGLAQDACSDGVAQPEGTEVCDSTVGPGQTVVYTFNTSFPGYWHYHDHGHTFDTGPAKGPLLGMQGSGRGLWGAFLVLEEGGSTDQALDLHLIDTGANGGLGLDGEATAGERFDLLVTALGEWDWFWTVTLNDPSGDAVGDVLVAPGVSRGIPVPDAQPGTYTWRAAMTEPYELYRGLLDGAPPFDERPDAQEGTIEVVEGSGGDGRQVESTATATLDPPPAAAAGAEPDRTFVIPFDFTTAQVDGLPMLEAYAGELLEFHVVRADAFAHVFHLHGHTWEDPPTGDFIDAVPLLPTDRETHTFTVVAGLDGGHVGDWLYHCHLNVDAHMWSVLRVYDDSMDVHGPLDDLQVTVTERDGRPVQGTALTVRWDPDAPLDPTLATAGQGTLLEAQVTETTPGGYTVQADLPHGATGSLVVESTHPEGKSVARLRLAGDGSYAVAKDMGLQHLDGLRAADPLL